MKKIYTIEINEKDKNLEDSDVIMAIDKDIEDFSNKLRDNTSVFIHLKRTGNVWKNLSEKVKKDKIKENKIKLTDSSDSNQSKITKYDHLKIVE
tara:strand:+ start:951 stop:1232 length:282 start_codon:yes stop_codon:yes gene_type:complete